MWLECSACDVSMYAGVYSFPMSNIMRTRAHTEDEEGCYKLRPVNKTDHMQRGMNDHTDQMCHTKLCNKRIVGIKADV